MRVPANFAWTCAGIKHDRMKIRRSSLGFSFSPGFALISVLALVSLAALTATAFLASARLERTATRPLGEKVRLEMALNIGLNCAKEIINDGVGSKIGRAHV